MYCNTSYSISLRHYTVFILVSLTYLHRRCTLMITVYMLTYGDLYTAGHQYMYVYESYNRLYISQPWLMIGARLTKCIAYDYLHNGNY